MKRRIIAIVMTLCMTLALLPVSALAVEGGGVQKPENPTVEKQVNGGDSTSAAAGETVEFTLTSIVPADLWKCFDFRGEVTVQSADSNLGTAIEDAAYTLTFHDTMDEKFSLDEDSMTVKIGETYVLNADTHYTSVTYDESPDGDNCTFHVTLDLVALYSAGIITDADYEQQTPIVVTYDATLADDATAGTYKNTTWVSWEKEIVDRGDPTDPVPEDPDPQPDPGESEEDEVGVYTCKISLLKLDKDDNEKKLSGAEFTLQIQNGENWDSIGTVTTDANGIAEWDGLKAGAYRLTEIKAPDGYVMDNTPIAIDIPDDAGEDRIVNVTFTNGSTPSTGGSGTMIYTAIGLALLACAAGVFVVSRKKVRR